MTIRESVIKAFPRAVVAMAMAMGMALQAVAVSASADDCHHCDQFQFLAQLSGLSTFAGDVSQRALHPEIDPFAWSQERRQAALLSIRASTIIPDECKEVLISRNMLRFTIVAQGNVGLPTPAYPSTRGDADKLINGYQSLVDSKVKNVCGSEPKIKKGESKSSYATALTKYTDCVETKGKDAFLTFQAQFDPQAAGKNKGPLAGITASQATVLQVYNHVVGLQTGDELDKYLKSVKGKLNTDQALLVGQMLASVAEHPGYDHAETNSEMASTDKILSTTENNILAGGSSKSQIAAMIKHAGVCRDIHSVIGIIERDLGIPHSVVVSFAQYGSGYHTTWAGQDPNQPLLNHQIDWGTRIDRVGGSSSSLNQGPSDAALSYFVSLPAGRTIADIQSQQGIWLAGAAGFRPNDPFARNEGYTIGGQSALGHDGNTRISLAVGQDGNGADYRVAGVGQSWNQAGSAPGQAALLMGTQVRDAAAFGNTDGKTYNLDFLYLQLEQKFKTGELLITPNLRARFEATVSAMAMVMRARDTGSLGGFGAKAGEINGTGDGHIGAAVVVNQGAPGGDTRVTYRAEVQIAPGIADIRNNGMQVPIPVLDGVFLSADIRHKLAATDQGRLYLVAAAKVAFDELGQRGRVEMGLATDTVAFTFGAEGRLSDGSATFQPGTARQIFGMFSWAPTKHLNLGVTAYVPVESASKISPNLLGTGVVKF